MVWEANNFTILQVWYVLWYSFPDPFPEISHERVLVNTVRVLQEFSDYIPENPIEVADILQKISERNAMSPHASNTNAIPWDTTFEPAETQCLLCGGQLSPAVRVPGSNCRAYLLTRLQLIPARSLIRRCSNRECGARHSYRTWKEGNHACAL